MKSSERGFVAIIDDDDAAREALHFLLQVLGRRPKSFSSAGEFLTAPADAFACLILDQNMPGMTGLELAQRLRSDENDIPIMLLSGGLTQDVVDRAARIGVEVVSDKPADVRLLERFMDNLVD